MEVSKIESRTVRMNEIDCSVMVRSEDSASFHYDMSKSEALQLAKDLLDACGVTAVTIREKPRPEEHPTPRTDVFSGMSLDEIQTEANKVWENKYNTTDVLFLAMLVANLAARMKEPEPDIAKCPCCEYEFAI